MEEQEFTIDLEKVKDWLVMKSEEMGRYDEDDSWVWGQKFAYEWIYAILTNEEDYNDILKDLEN